jgi:chromosome partitioning protein
MQQTVQAAQQIGKPCAVVMTFCPPSGPEVDQARQIVQKQGAGLVPAALHQRKAYGRAQMQGLAPQEYEPEEGCTGDQRTLHIYTSTAIRSNEAWQQNGPISQTRLTM